MFHKLGFIIIIIIIKNIIIYNKIVNESQDQQHLRQDKTIVYVPPRDFDTFTCLTYSDEVADSGIFRYFLRRETKFRRNIFMDILDSTFWSNNIYICRNWFIAVL